MNPIIPTWMTNSTIWAGVFAWILAQAIKTIYFFARTRRINFALFISTGGMPSAHSAFVAALATSVGLRGGTAEPLFAVTVAFALVVMFDAQNVRRATGLQARVLNQIVDELFKTRRVAEGRLVELLGHTPLEVFFGMIIGILVAILVHSFVLR